MTAPTVKAIATWSDQDGNTYTWPQALADNRRTRVLARIHRFQIPCDESTLVITRGAA